MIIQLSSYLCCETQNVAGNQHRSDLLFCHCFPRAVIFLCSGKPILYTALGYFVLMFPGSACLGLFLALWVFSWANKCGFVIGFSTAHRSYCHFALCQTCQHHSLAPIKVYSLLVTGNTECCVMKRYYSRPVLHFCTTFFFS